MPGLVAPDFRTSRSPLRGRGRATRFGQDPDPRPRVRSRPLASCARTLAAMCEACHDESERPLLVPVVTDRSHHTTPLHFTRHCTAASAAAAGLCGSECGACGLARTCSLTTPRPRSPRHRFFWIGELEVSAANLQGGGERAVRLLSGLCVPFRLLLFCVVHASQCPVPFEGPSKCYSTDF